MAIDRITQKILADAEAEAEKISLEADQKIEAIHTQTAKTVAEIEERARNDSAHEADEQRRRIHSRAQAEMRKEYLGEKQKLIGQAFEKALTSTRELNEKAYATLMKTFLLESVESGDEEVIVASQDQGRDWNEIISAVNRDVSSTGMKGLLTLSSETRKMAGGFVLRKGKREVNCDLELIVGSLREELESEVAEALFSEASPPVSEGQHGPLNL